MHTLLCSRQSPDKGCKKRGSVFSKISIDERELGGSVVVGIAVLSLTHDESVDHSYLLIHIGHVWYIIFIQLNHISACTRNLTNHPSELRHQERECFPLTHFLPNPTRPILRSPGHFTILDR